MGRKAASAPPADQELATLLGLPAGSKRMLAELPTIPELRSAQPRRLQTAVTEAEARWRKIERSHRGFFKTEAEWERFLKDASYPATTDPARIQRITQQAVRLVAQREAQREPNG